MALKMLLMGGRERRIEAVGDPLTKLVVSELTHISVYFVHSMGPSL